MRDLMMGALCLAIGLGGIAVGYDLGHDVGFSRGVEDGKATALRMQVEVRQKTRELGACQWVDAIAEAHSCPLGPYLTGIAEKGIAEKGIAEKGIAEKGTAEKGTAGRGAEQTRVPTSAGDRHPQEEGTDR